MSQFIARITRAARECGSTATTLRGQIRYLVGCPRAPQMMLRAMAAQLSDAAPTARPELSDEQRQDRRAAADARYRRTLLARLRREYSAPMAGPSECDARSALAARIKRIAPKSAPLAPIYHVVQLCSVAADRLGWDRRGKDCEWRSGAALSVSHTAGSTEWKNGSPRHYTRAERMTTIQSVAFVRADGVVYIARGTKRSLDCILPAGTRPEQVTAGCLLDGDAYAIRGADGTCTRYTAAGKITGYACQLPADLMDRWGRWEHAATPEGLAAEVDAKRKILASAARYSRATRRDDRAVRLLARISATPVVYSDARAAGACAAGIEAWAADRGVSVSAAIPCRVLHRDQSDRARGIALHFAAQLWAGRNRTAVAA